MGWRTNFKCNFLREGCEKRSKSKSTRIGVHGVMTLSGKKGRLNEIYSMSVASLKLPVNPHGAAGIATRLMVQTLRLDAFSSRNPCQTSG